MFVSNPDRTVPTILLGEDLKTIWQETSQLLWTEFVKLSVADWLQTNDWPTEVVFCCFSASDLLVYESALRES